MSDEVCESSCKGVVNLLKSRDDRVVFRFYAKEDGSLEFDPENKCHWLENKKELKPDTLRPRIEPWLTALFQSESLSLLVGSGLMHAVHFIAAEEQATSMDLIEFEVYKEEINCAAEASAKTTIRSKPNIEDQLRIANEIMVGLSHYVNKQAADSEMKLEVDKLHEEINYHLGEFISSIQSCENNLILAEKEKKDEAFGYLVNFLMSFASRTGTRERLQIFTTNYDRLIEFGAELAGLHLLDRFIGNLTPIFHSSRLNVDMHYNPPGIRGEPRYLEGVAKYTKLHGSIDWLYFDRVVRRIGLPFGAKDIKTFLNTAGLNDSQIGNVMVYPNSAKDRETAEYPYVELFRDFAVSVCRPNNTLVTYGYGFGDEHINRTIEDMLTIPSTHLVIISYDDPLNRIMKTYQKIARPDQITLLVGNHLGDLKILVDNYLPKSAIDRTTIRMAELLKARIGPESSINTEGRENHESDANGL